MAIQIQHGKRKKIIRQIKQNAQSANNKLITELTAGERNTLLVIALHKLGLVDDDGRVDLSTFREDA